MAERTELSVDSLAVDNSPEGILVFDKEGSLLRNNGKATLLVASFEPGAIVIREEDILSLFGLEPLPQNNCTERKYVANVRKSLFIQRNRTDTGIVIYYLVDTSGERLRMTALHHQTSDTLWKIRSRVTSVQNALSYLADYESDRFDDDIKDLLNSSRFEIWQLSRYADTLRDLALLNANVLGKQLDIEDISLKECIVEAVINLDAFKNNWGKKMFYLDRTPAWPVRCDKNRFVRIIESVLVNSVMYGPPEVKVTIDAEIAQDGMVSVIIRDNGNGIAAADLPKVFESGFRGHAARMDGCPGLGMELYLARQIMTRMDGGIVLENGQHGGTETTLTLMKGKDKDERAGA